MKNITLLACLFVGVFVDLSAKADQRHHYLVTGSFASEGSAENQLVEVSKHFQSAHTKAIVINGEPRYRVLVGPINDHAQAEKIQQDAEQHGFNNAWTFAQTIASNASNASDVSDVSNSAVQTTNSSQRVSEQSETLIQRFIYETPVLATEVEEILAPYTGTRVKTQQLLAAKDQINQLFVTHGYVNSGALIPDQQISNGELKLEFISGKINDVQLESALKPRYVESRLRIREPFNLAELQYQLKLLEQDPLVTRIDARVAPGINPGEASLALNVETKPRFKIGLTGANDRSPSIGSENARLDLSSRNLTGWGETISVGTSVTEGLDAHDALISIPLSSGGLSMDLQYTVSDSSVIEEPFDDIDVESETESLGLMFNLPIIKNLSRSLSVQLTLEARRNQTSLLGQPFSFSEGAINGESRVAPVRLAIAYTQQNINDSLAARFSLSRGTTNFDATENVGLADGQFTSYLAQLQYSKLLAERLHMTMRVLVQHAEDPLLSVERYALGGVNTVRGYRQNQVVRDNAYLASAELHYRLDLPVFVDLIGFVDWGSGENHDDATTGGKVDLSSIGLGISIGNWRGFSATLYVAHGFDDFTSTEHDLQDDGVHFQLGYYREF